MVAPIFVTSLVCFCCDCVVSASVEMMYTLDLLDSERDDENCRKCSGTIERARDQRRNDPRCRGFIQRPNDSVACVRCTTNARCVCARARQGETRQRARMAATAQRPKLCGKDNEDDAQDEAQEAANRSEAKQRGDEAKRETVTPGGATSRRHTGSVAPDFQHFVFAARGDTLAVRTPARR